MYKVTVYIGRKKTEYFYSISGSYIQSPEFGVMVKLDPKEMGLNLLVVEYDILHQIFGKEFENMIKRITRVQFDRIEVHSIVIKSFEFYEEFPA